MGVQGRYRHHQLLLQGIGTPLRAASPALMAQWVWSSAPRASSRSTPPSTARASPTVTPYTWSSYPAEEPQALTAKFNECVQLDLPRVQQQQVESSQSINCTDSLLRKL